MKKAC